MRHAGDAHYGQGPADGDDRYESGDLIVHFFDWKLIDDLAAGLEVLGAVEFEEGGRRSGRACSRALLLRFPDVGPRPGATYVQMPDMAWETRTECTVKDTGGGMR